MARNKDRKKKIFIGVTLILFLVSSIGGFILSTGNQQTNINRFTIDEGGKKFLFVRNRDNSGNYFYEVTSKDEEFMAFIPPDQIVLDDSELEIGSNFFYLSFDPSPDDLSVFDYLRFDIKNNLPKSYFFQDAITEEHDQYNLPIVDCSNATASSPVVILEQSNSTEIWKEDNCVHIEFLLQDTIVVRDSLIYSLYDIR